MVVRLMGDGTDYQSMLGEAQSATQAATSAIMAGGKSIEGISTSIRGFATAAVQSLAALGAVNWLKGALHSFQEQASVERQLTNIMEINGRQVETLMGQYQEFASAIQQTTTVADEQALALIKQAELFGVTGDAAMRAAKNAIALAAVHGGEAGGFVRQTAMLEQGKLGRLSMLLGMGELEEGTDKVAAAQEKLAKMFQFAQKESQSLGGQIKQLKNFYDDLMEDFGKVISEFTKPMRLEIIDRLKDAIDWVKSWSDQAKLAVVAGAGIVAGILAIGPAIAAIKFVGAALLAPLIAVGGVIASLGPLLIPIGIAIGAVVLLIKGWINHMGGLKATWDAMRAAAGVAWDYIVKKAMQFWNWIQPAITYLEELWTAMWTRTFAAAQVAWEYTKQAVSAFWDWVKPILQALWSLTKAVFEVAWQVAQEAWEIIKPILEAWWELTLEMFQSIWDTVVEVWTAIVGDTEVTWTDIGDMIRDSILFAEFVLRNFKDVAAFVWTAVQLGAVVLFNEIEYFFVTELPAWLGWFGHNFVAVFVDVFNYIGTVSQNFFDNFTGIFGRIADAFIDFLDDPSEGITINTEGIWTPLETGFRSSLQALPDIAAREMGELEAQLREEFAAQGGALAASWEEFRAMRLFEFGLDPEELDEATTRAERAGLQIGNAMGKGKHKGAEKWDAALLGSAEATFRIQAFRDSVERGGREETHVAGMDRLTGSTDRIGDMLAPGMTPGSIFVHDTHCEAILEDILVALENPAPMFGMNNNFEIPQFADLEESAVNAIDELKEELKQSIRQLTEDAHKFLDEMRESTVSLLDRAGTALEEFKDSLVSAVEAVQESMTTGIDSITESVTGFIDSGSESVNAFLDQTRDALVEGFNTIATGADESMRDLGTTLGETADRNLTRTTDAVIRIIDTVGQALTDIVTALRDIINANPAVRASRWVNDLLGPAGGPAPAAPAQQPVINDGHAEDWRALLTILREANTLLTEIRNRPPVIFEGADLEE